VKTLSVDLRERILDAYDAQEGTRDEIASRFRVSLGMVKKLLQQRRHTGDISPRHHFSGRKPKILPRHRDRMLALLTRKPDLTLAELRQAVRLKCTLPAIHYALVDMDMTYKKRRSAPASKAARKSPPPETPGNASSANATPAT